MTLAIPKEAMPVVDVLRRDVEKPRKDTIDASGGFGCGWFSSFTRGGLPLGFRCCPMGLHDRSCSRTPDCPEDFANGEVESPVPIMYFANWWDRLSLEHAKQAVDLIWPEAENK